MTSAPITTADMREKLIDAIAKVLTEDLTPWEFGGEEPMCEHLADAVLGVFLARLEQQETPFDPNTRIRVPLDLVSAPVVAPQPETPALTPKWTVEAEEDAEISRLAALLAASHDEAIRLGIIGCLPIGPKPAPSVSVDALRALPRYNFADPRDYATQWTLRPVNIVPDPEGDWVGWSDLAALWPPQTGDGK